MRQAIERLHHRVLNLLTFARVVGVDDSGSVQKLQVQTPSGELIDAKPSAMLYGVSSHPPVGTDVALLAMAGDRVNSIVVATNNQTYRMTGLAGGEVAIYNNAGMSVVLTGSGIVVNGGGSPITFKNATKARFEMPVESTGEIAAHADSNPIHLTTHTHPTAQPGGPSSPTPGS